MVLVVRWSKRFERAKLLFHLQMVLLPLCGVHPCIWTLYASFFVQQHALKVSWDGWPVLTVQKVAVSEGHVFEQEGSRKVHVL